MTPHQILQDKQNYISRELSWLDFNFRVLEEAASPANPLLERLKFIAIFSSNLDEFFMVRVAGLRQMVKIGEDKPDVAGVRPSEQLLKINHKVTQLQKEQYRLLYDEILPGLRSKDICLRRLDELDELQRNDLNVFFRQQILPILTPIAIDPSHPFPIISNGAIEIAVSLKKQEDTEEKSSHHAFIEVPEALPRFIQINSTSEKKQFVLIEDLVMDNLQSLFLDCEIKSCFPFRIIRDMDFSVDDTGVEDLMRSIEHNLLQRRQREPIRLEIVEGADDELTRWLMGEFHLDKQFKYSMPGMLHLKNCFELVGKADSPDLLEENWTPITPQQIESARSIFEAINEHNELFLALPFHSFSPVVRFLNEAADDPNVLAIKQTLYRVSGNSPVVHALQRAAQNGKKVTVIVELKARFDEGNNIAWARRLEESGAHVIYGISGLKIHCKALLVIRREDGMMRRYVHLATGNYNDKTATLYTDMGIFSNSETLCNDISTLFNIMTGFSAAPREWNEIAASPFSMRKKVLGLIEREVKNVTAGASGKIIAKMNSLVDPEVISHLIAAAHAGVEIDLIVRGICCLKPPKGLKNIRIISIVDRFLEHTRLFYFFNNGNPEYYLSSADWMYRNLDRRIEILFPVRNSEACRVFARFLEFQLNDVEKARKLQSNGIYSRLDLGVIQHNSSRSQRQSYLFLRQTEIKGNNTRLDNLTIYGNEISSDEESGA